jgi:hypothetical protein
MENYGCGVITKKASLVNVTVNYIAPLCMFYLAARVLLHVAAAAQQIIHNVLAAEVDFSSMLVTVIRVTQVALHVTVLVNALIVHLVNIYYWEPA